MTRARAAAGLAAILTALLLQGTVIGPWAGPVPVSLPAVLVAAVALVDGPGSGMAFGFVAGLLADLGSTHPAGVLALCWLGVGLACGLLADRHSVRRDAAAAAIVCALASLAGSVLLAVVHADGASVGSGLVHVVPAGIADALLALLLVPLARRFLHTDQLRAPRASTDELLLAGRRG
ncbi:MAG TPA: rod shape-determining protein MreD [Jatrophihabitantaceae bacterium]|nr:rod shape-determining protein MreD [Jatrophihabitantaceae bacterium]